VGREGEAEEIQRQRIFWTFVETMEDMIYIDGLDF
jgi:hypothetical protein